MSIAVAKKRQAHLRPNKQGVELGEHSEHFVGISSRAQPITKSRNDLVFHTGNSLVVSVLSRDPDLGTLCVELVRCQ